MMIEAKKNQAGIAIKLFLPLLMFFLFSSSHRLYGFGGYQSHPRDGQFKQQPSSRDKWYYFDAQRWYIKAPDKFQHMMGSYALTEIGGLVANKYVAAAATLGLGLYKEYDDAYREGWSSKDLLMDLAGIGASLFNNRAFSMWMNWDEGAIILTLSFGLK